MIPEEVVILYQNRHHILVILFFIAWWVISALSKAQDENRKLKSQLYDAERKAKRSANEDHRGSWVPPGISDYWPKD